MGEDRKDYLMIMAEVDKLVEDSMKEELPMTSLQKIAKISGRLNSYLVARKSADYNAKMEKKNPDKYKPIREYFEYMEMLEQSRIRHRIKSMSERELEMYVSFLQGKLHTALEEKDNKKRFKMYDYIIAGC